MAENQRSWQRVEIDRLTMLLDGKIRSLANVKAQLADAECHLVEVLSLNAENVEGVARAMLSAEHAAFLTLHPELKEEQFTYQIAYFKGLKVCATAALQHLRQQAGLPVEEADDS